MRFELDQLNDISLVDICVAASVLGLEPSVSLHRVGPALRDKGHAVLIGRLLRHVSPAWHVAREVPFPNHGDPRWWDLLRDAIVRQRMVPVYESRPDGFPSPTPRSPPGTARCGSISRTAWNCSVA